MCQDRFAPAPARSWRERGGSTPPLQLPASPAARSDETLLSPSVYDLGRARTGSPIVALYHCSLRPAFIERFDGWRAGPATLTSINMCRMSLAIRRRGLSAMGKARPDLAAPNPQLLAARRGVPARLAADQAEQWDGADKFATGVDQRSHRPHGGGAASCSGQAKAKSHQMRYDTEPNR